MPHLESTYSLRHRPFDSCSCSIFLFELAGDLPRAGCLQRFVLVFWPDRQRSPRWCRLRTLGLLRTGATVRRCELELDHIVVAVVDRQRPTDAAAPLWASRLL